MGQLVPLVIRMLLNFKIVQKIPLARIRAESNLAAVGLLLCIRLASVARMRLVRMPVCVIRLMIFVHLIRARNTDVI
jgi:hypothetical protein